MFPRWHRPQTCQSADDISVHTKIIKIQQGDQENNFYQTFYLIFSYFQKISFDAINSLGTSTGQDGLSAFCSLSSPRF